MRIARVAVAIAATAVIAVAGWFGYRHFVAPRSGPVAAVDRPMPVAEDATSTEVTTADGTPRSEAGTTPMAQRVAVVGLLNKRNGVARDLTMTPGQSMRVGDAIVRLRACDHTAPWEQQTLTGAFVQLDVQGVDKAWRRAFSGWVFKERPQLNVVLHPVYDVWVKSCTMSFPETGPGTVSVAGPAGPSAKKSAAAGAKDDDDAGEEQVEPSAAPSNAT